MRKLVDCIIKVVSDPESMKNPQLLNDTISGYEEQKYEWGNLLQENNGGNYKEGFYNFMKSVDIVNLKDDEIDEALEYLHGHLEGEVGLWKEVEVKETLKDWRISQQVSNGSGYTGVGDIDTGGNYVSDTPVTPPYNPGDINKKRDELKDKLKFMPSSEAKDLLQEIIENEGGLILDTLLKYVQ